MLWRSDSSSLSSSVRLTRSTQSGGRSIGHVANEDAPPPCRERDATNSTIAIARHAEQVGHDFASRSTYRATTQKGSSLCTGNGVERTWSMWPSLAYPRCSCHRRTCVMVMRRIKRGSPPSCSGQSSGCQWFGINDKAQIRIGDWSARFPQDAVERLEMRRLLEQRHARNAAIQDVKVHPSGSDRAVRGMVTPQPTTPHFVDTGPVPLFALSLYFLVKTPLRLLSALLGFVPG